MKIADKVAFNHPRKGISLPTINYASAINDLADEISQTAEQKGFWDYEDVGDLGLIPLKIALIHDEASEALQVHRKDYDDGDIDSNSTMTEMQEEDFAGEVADIIIRALDLGGYFDWNMGDIILNKMEHNRSRPHRHGKRY